MREYPGRRSLKNLSSVIKKKKEDQFIPVKMQNLA
jgi:hypothetical protein